MVGSCRVNAVLVTDHLPELQTGQWVRLDRNHFLKTTAILSQHLNANSLHLQYAAFYNLLDMLTHSRPNMLYCSAETIN